MYALLPAFVSSLFLFYGAYVITTRGRTRASLAFFGIGFAPVPPDTASHLS